MGIKKYYHKLFAADPLLSKKVKDFSRKTYSQSGEDIILQHLFGMLNIKQPSYIDVGAHHPHKINNTAIFYDQGSRGINIEPDPGLFQEFIKSRSEDINLNIGISANTGTLPLYIMSSPSLNTFSKEEAERMERETNYRIVDRKEIKVDTIQHVVDQYNNGKFPDLLSLDVEGLDEKILRSIDFAKYRPAAICVETLTFTEKGEESKIVSTIKLLEENDYYLYADTYINSIFVDKEKWKRR
jgi:FkbM family methyltransferase